MAQIRSQLKRNLTNEAARVRNAAKKSAMRTAIRKVKAAAESKNKELTLVEMKKALALIDKAKDAGVIKKNTAARKKSALEKLYSSLSAA